MKKSFALLAITTALLPTLTYAQDATTGITNLGALIRVFTTSIVQSLAYLMLTAAVVAFFFGIVQYIWGIRQGDGTKAKTGSNFMVWGLIALFVMFSVWGIVTYAQRILGIQGQSTITIPDIQFKTTGTTVNPFVGSVTGGGGSIPYTVPAKSGGVAPIQNGGGGGNTSTSGVNSGTGSSGTSNTAKTSSVNTNTAQTSTTQGAGTQVTFSTSGSSVNPLTDLFTTVSNKVTSAWNTITGIFTGNSSTQGDNIDAGGGWNPAAGGAIDCGEGFHPDSNGTGCVVDSGQEGGATTNSCGDGWHPDSNGVGCVPDENTSSADTTSGDNIDAGGGWNPGTNSTDQQSSQDTQTQ